MTGSRRFAGAAVVVAGLGAVTCFANLSVASAGVDEVTYAKAGWAYVHGDTLLNREHPFLAKLVIGVSEVVLGRNPLGVRLPDAVLGYATGAVVFWLAARLAGRWAGLIAAAVWLLLPQAPGTEVLRLDRYGALEPTMTFCVALSCACCLEAVRRERLRSATRWLLGAGAAAGLAGAAKWPGVVAVGPVLVAVWQLRARAWQRVAALGGAAALGGLAFLAPYWVTGDVGLTAMRYAIRFQSHHAAEGHPQLVAGHIYRFAPWWANWWWEQAYLGLAATVALWLAAVLGLLIARDRRPRFVVAALLGSAVLFVATMPILLPHYHLIWVVPLAVGAGVAFTRLARLARLARLPGRRWLARITAVALAVPLVVTAGETIGSAVTLARADYGRLPTVLAADHVAAGPVMVWGWPQVAAWSLPRQWPALARAAHPVAVVVDPVVADRQQGSAEQAAVDRVTRGCARQQVDRLTVYLCRR